MDRTLHPIATIRRLHLHLRMWLLLPVLLAVSQHGAWLHELSHAAYAASPHQVSIRQAQDCVENDLCPLCQSFGQLGSALSSSVAAVAAPIAHLRSQTAPQYSQPSAELTAPRNRGPPQLA